MRGRALTAPTASLDCSGWTAPSPTPRRSAPASPLLARFDGKNGFGQWRIAAGTYRIALAKSAGDLVLTAEAPLTARVFGK